MTLFKAALPILVSQDQDIVGSRNALLNPLLRYLEPMLHQIAIHNKTSDFFVSP